MGRLKVRMTTSQRSKKFDPDRNFWSRSNFFNVARKFQSRRLDFPQKIGPRWVARSKISFSLEMFNPDRNLEFFWSLGPLGSMQIAPENAPENKKKISLLHTARHKTNTCMKETSGTKKEHKPRLLSPDIFWRGRRLPCEGVGAKSSVCLSKPEKSNFLGGISRYPGGAWKAREKKKFSIFGPYFWN